MYVIAVTKWKTGAFYKFYNFFFKEKRMILEKNIESQKEQNFVFVDFD